MSFTNFWKKEKLPDLGNINMWQIELIRKIALRAFHAGQKSERDRRNANHK